MPTLIEKNAVMDLTEYLNSPDAAIKADDPFPGLAAWTKGKGGQGIYGMPVDCNPYVTWFNKDMLNAAGIDQDPAMAFEAGTWNLDTITNMLETLRKAGKRPLVFESGWSLLCSWITTFGGTAFDDDGAGDPVFNEDPKAMQTITWLFDQMKAKNIVYAGSLPKGQGADALFYAEQLAMYQVGRWILPNLKKLKFGYDIAPFPSEEGNVVKPVAVATAAMSVNAKAKDPEVALEFLGNFVNRDGQRFRLSGGGNAVPCVSGLDSVVTEGGLPKHGKWFLDVAKAGYAVPPAVIRDPEVGANFGTKMDEWLKAGKDTPKSFADKLVNLIMSGEGA
jgi:multiple sugar transport system substrate-binding protein